MTAEFLVLVENLGSATASLRIYFWLDGGQHSGVKGKSSVIRLTKRAFQDAGISLPDKARGIDYRGRKIRPGDHRFPMAAR